MAEVLIQSTYVSFTNGDGVVVNSTTGQQLWVWLRGSRGESWSQVKVSVRWEEARRTRGTGSAQNDLVQHRSAWLFQALVRLHEAHSPSLSDDAKGSEGLRQGKQKSQLFDLI